MAKKRAPGAVVKRNFTTRSTATPITEECKGYGRAAVRLKVARAVWTFWDNLRESEGVDQTWLVERLDSNKGRVSRLLNNPGNWTLDTVADLLEAMEARLTLVEVKRYRDVGASSNVDPSLKGLRDYPALWNVIISNVEGEEDVESPLLSRTISTLPMLNSVALPRIVSSEPS